MLKCNFLITIILLIPCLQLVSCQRYVDSRQVKCLVCKVTIKEMEEAISLVDPKKTADVSGFRMDSIGNSKSKTVQLVKSETYLSELMENICDKTDDYAKATYKSNGRLLLVKLLLPDGRMNPEMSEVNFVQDGDLNKSLKHFCLEILDEQYEIIMNHFMKDKLANNLDIQICSETGKYCKDNQSSYNDDDYQLEEDEHQHGEL